MISIYISNYERNNIEIQKVRDSQGSGIGTSITERKRLLYKICINRNSLLMKRKEIVCGQELIQELLSKMGYYMKINVYYRNALQMRKIGIVCGHELIQALETERDYSMDYKLNFILSLALMVPMYDRICIFYDINVSVIKIKSFLLSVRQEF